MKIINKIKSLLSGSSASGNAVLVTIGTVFGQAALILATPVISRLYSPSEMGVYAVFASLVGLFSVIIAGHYELAIPSSKNIVEARRILKLSLVVVVVASLVLGFLFVVFRHEIGSALDSQALIEYIWLAPIMLLLSGVATVLGYWSIKRKTFHLTAVSKCMQGVGQVTPQVILGFFSFGIIGLIAGQLLAQMLSILSLAPGVTGKNSVRNSSDTIQKFAVLAKRYRSFPLFTIWSSLINALSSHLPVLVLAYLFGPLVTGLYALSFRILQVPSRFIGQSISQVFFSIAADAHREDKLRGITENLFRGLFAFGLPSFIALAVIAPELFGWLFGNEWREAGVYSQALMPWILLSFVTTTLSILVSIMNRQSMELLFQVLILFATLISLGFGLIVNDALIVVWVLGVVSAVMLFIKLLWLLHIVGINLRASLGICIKELPFTVLLIGVYLIMNFVFGEGLLSVLAIAVTLACLHLYNLKIRRIYGFGR